MTLRLCQSVSAFFMKMVLSRSCCWGTVSFALQLSKKSGQGSVYYFHHALNCWPVGFVLLPTLPCACWHLCPRQRCHLWEYDWRVHERTLPEGALQCQSTEHDRLRNSSFLREYLPPYRQGGNQRWAPAQHSADAGKNRSRPDGLLLHRRGSWLWVWSTEAVPFVRRKVP